MSAPRTLVALVMLVSLMALAASLVALGLGLVPVPGGVAVAALSLLTGWLAASLIDNAEG